MAKNLRVFSPYHVNLNRLTVDLEARQGHVVSMSERILSFHCTYHYIDRSRDSQLPSFPIQKNKSLLPDSSEMEVRHSPLSMTCQEHPVLYLRFNWKEAKLEIVKRESHMHLNIH